MPRIIQMRGDKIYLYREKVGTGPKLTIVAAYKGKRKSSGSNFIVEGPTEEKVINYLIHHYGGDNG